ncbi:MAG: hypothetical protein HS116_13165 [Planctomycetes bacterium]|nr:hypothetical protein [Planctomycetota bacterium]
MALTYDFSRQIARNLAELWNFHKKRLFLTYCSSVYKQEIVELPCFEMIYIAEVSNGDSRMGVIGSQVCRWWGVDDKGLRECEVEVLDFSIRGSFYVCPVLKFLAHGSWCAIGEKLGPQLAKREVAKLHVKQGEISISERRVIWIGKPDNVDHIDG